MSLLFRIFAVFVGCVLAFGASAQTSCSVYAGQFRINEYYFGTGSTYNFVEFHTNNSSMAAAQVWKNGAGFRARVYDDKGAFVRELSYASATGCSSGSATWVQSGASGISMPAKGGTTVLLDASGNLIDYFVFGDAPYPSTGVPAASVCAFAHDVSANDVTGIGGTKGLRRLPDGIGNWSLMSNTGAGTEGTNCASNNDVNLAFGATSYTTPVGSSFTVTLNVQNQTGSAVSGVPVQLTIPFGFTLTATSVPSGTFSGSTWTTGTLGALSSQTITLTFTAPSSAGTSSLGASITNAAVANVPLIVENPVRTVSVSGAPSASVCSPTSLQVSVRDASSALVPNYSGTVSLSTSTGRGTWSKGALPGALSAGANNGQATYTFAGTEGGAATLSLDYPYADDITVTVTQSINGQTSTHTVSFSDVGFVITPNDALGSAVGVAGRPYQMQVQMFRATGNVATPANRCTVDANYTAGRTVRATRILGAFDTSVLAPQISPTLPSALTQSCFGQAQSVSIPSSGSAPVNLNFTNGVAPFWVCSADVGQFQVQLSDTSRTFAGNRDIVGTSNQVTLRPLGLSMRQIVSGSVSNPAGTATAGSGFVAAATPFRVTVGGTLWEPTDDSISAGQPNSAAAISTNAWAPGYQGTLTLSAIGQTPSAPVTGSLTGTTSIASAAFSLGRATVSDLRWSEVGSVTLRAQHANFWGTGVAVPSTDSGAIGRFFPASFEMLSSAVTGQNSGTLLYMGDDALFVGVSVQARNALGARTFNYHTPTYGFTATPTWLAKDGTSGTNLASRINFPTVGWDNGRFVMNRTDLVFSPAASADGPYRNLTLGVAFNDADGARLSDMDTHFAAGPCTSGCTAKALLGAADVRLGRIAMRSVTSSIGVQVRIPIEVQYWDSARGWVLNTSDSVTSIPLSSVTLGGYQGLTGVSAVALPQVIGGKTVLTLGVPTGTSGSRAKADVALNLGATAGSLNSCIGGLTSTSGASMSHMRGAWCGTGAQDPSTRIYWGGINKGSALVFSRELF